LAKQLTTAQRKAVFANLGIAKVQGEKNTFQVSSKSDPTQKSYFIDIHDPRQHKRDCLGFRFAKGGKLCNHLKRLKEAGLKVKQPEEKL